MGILTLASTDAVGGWRAWRLRRFSFSGTGTFQNIGGPLCSSCRWCFLILFHAAVGNFSGATWEPPEHYPRVQNGRVWAWA